MTMPRILAVDVYGETVDLYDFANHGRQVVVHLSSSGAAGSSFLEDLLYEDPGIDRRARVMQNAFAHDEFYWVTVLSDHAWGLEPDLVAWENSLPGHPTFADDGGAYDWFLTLDDPTSPTLVLDETMRIRQSGAIVEMADFLAQEFEEEYGEPWLPSPSP